MTPPSDLRPIRPSYIVEGQLLRSYRRAIVQACKAAEHDADAGACIELTDARHVADVAIQLWSDGQW